MAVDETHLAERLGEVSGTLNGLKETVGDVKETVGGIDEKISKLDDRLRKVEQRTYAGSAVISGVVAVGIALIKDKLGS